MNMVKKIYVSVSFIRFISTDLILDQGEIH